MDKFVKLQNAVAIAEAMAQLSSLANKQRLTPDERRKYEVLKQKVSLLKAGYTLDEANTAELNEVEARNGLPASLPPRAPLTPAQRYETERWRNFIRSGRAEYRVGLTGTPNVQPGQDGGSMGTFVPVEYFRDELPRTFATISPLLDPDRVHVIYSSNGRPLELPFLSDISNVAVVIGEATQDSPTDLAKTGAKFLNAFNYRSPFYTASYEALQDLEESFGLVEMFKAFAGERLARGIGKDLMLGNGSGKPTGILSALTAAGAPVVTAAGSAANTGGTETGATSIGLADIAKLYTSVPAVYRKSKKCGWIMSDNTLNYLRGLVSRQGTPVFPREPGDSNGDGDGTLFGKPVLADLNIPNIAASQQTVIFGDLSYWCTRLVLDAGYVRVFKEFAGGIEKGIFALRAFLRADGILKVNDATFQGIAVLQQHS